MKECKRAESQTRNQTKSLSEEDAGSGVGLFSHQEQTESGGARGRREVAALCIRRTPPQEARFPFAVDHPHRSRMPGCANLLQQVHQRSQESGHRSEPQDFGRHGGQRRSRVCGAGGKSQSGARAAVGRMSTAQQELDTLASLEERITRAVEVGNGLRAAKTGLEARLRTP